jgi:WD40 repeat protein
LFKYPSPVANSSFNSYSGHSSHVSNVKFSFDDEFIISTGGNEKSIIQWRYKYDPTIQSEIDELHAAPEEKKHDDLLFDYEERDNGERSTAVKPFLGQLPNTQPTNFRSNP